MTITPSQVSSAMQARFAVECQPTEDGILLGFVMESHKAKWGVAFNKNQESATASSRRNHDSQFASSF